MIQCTCICTHLSHKALAAGLQLRPGPHRHANIPAVQKWCRKRKKKLREKSCLTRRKENFHIGILRKRKIRILRTESAAPLRRPAGTGRRCLLPALQLTPVRCPLAARSPSPDPPPPFPPRRALGPLQGPRGPRGGRDFDRGKRRGQCSPRGRRNRGPLPRWHGRCEGWRSG